MKKNFCTAILFSICYSVYSQDTQYWTQQFGTRSALLGGAVVASADDNTALYYNPGALGFIDTGSLTINANIYGIENIKIFNAIGQHADFRSSQISTVPLLIGGMLNNKGKAWKLSYGLMAPVDFNFKATARLDNSYNIVADNESPGSESLIGQVDLSTRVSEILLGFGGGRKLNDYWSIGVGGFFAVHSQVYNRSSLVRVFMNPDTKLVSSTIIQSLNYYNVRFMPNIGVNWRKGKWKAGLAITSPSISFFGRGAVAVDATGTNIRPPSAASRLDVVANDRQEKLKTIYKSPISISGGLSYSWSKSQAHFSAAYFGKVSQYDIIQAKAASFARPTDAYPEFTSDEFLRVRTAAIPVFNFALAYEYALREDFDLDISFRTNQSFYDSKLADQRGLKPSLSTWNIKHVVIGVNKEKNRSQLSLGVLYSFGADNDRAQHESLENPSEGNMLQGQTVITKAKYSSIGLLLGFTLNFKKF